MPLPVEIPAPVKMSTRSAQRMCSISVTREHRDITRSLPLPVVIRPVAAWDSLAFDSRQEASSDGYFAATGTGMTNLPLFSATSDELVLELLPFPSFVSRVMLNFFVTLS